MVTFTDSDDRRSEHLRNQAIQNANAVRERRATVENPQWAMSRDADWYLDRGNLASVKGTLASQQGNRDFWTTDQDESRNMYQMIMNNMVGGGGARMMDLRGLPSVVQSDPNRYRRGRTMFQDPSKAQGFLGDVRSLFTGKNRAAVYADEYNPFHEEGYGRDWYVGEFGQPWGEKLEGLMKLFLPGPLKWMKEREREPLPSDRSWIPEDVGEYDEIPEIPFMEDLDLLAPYVENSEMDISESPYYGRGELSEDFDYSQFPSGVDEEIIKEPEEITETFTDLGDTHDFTESWKRAFDATDYIDVQEYVKTMSNTEGSLWYGKDEDWIVKDMIKRNYIGEK